MSRSPNTTKVLTLGHDRAYTASNRTELSLREGTETVECRRRVASGSNAVQYTSYYSSNSHRFPPIMYRCHMHLPLQQSSDILLPSSMSERAMTAILMLGNLVLAWRECRLLSGGDPCRKISDMLIPCSYFALQRNLLPATRACEKTFQVGSLTWPYPTRCIFSLLRCWT